ncbi:patatin-like phospholipase family protein [Salinarimonas rosea]|uniref:patatin-like phospholipase family protein n=1 Tax=Salinarimonas rosea TaxID=552063 RepID=UPI00040ACD6B|nr:patatin-like phospholipase family protein [Salinarimonas rosea]
MADEAPARACDVIMKGGVTSGVVYPGAVLELAKRYRFRSIGGTSVGAIAAAITAAAELDRAGGGFDVVAGLPKEITQRLPQLFQPAPEARALYAIVRHGLIDRRLGRAAWALLVHHGQFVLVGAMIALVLGLFSTAIGGSLFAVLFALLVFALVTVGLTAWSVIAGATRVLRENFCGLCPGPTQPDTEGVGLADWLAEAIEAAAGRPAPEDREALRTPLTFGDLAANGPADAPEDAPGRITLAMMTTNLAMRRPHRLPELARTGPHEAFSALYFREDEFRRVMPGWIVDWMTRGPKSEPGPQEGLWRLPGPDDLPVAVATRMSLSFPILISAVPLHAPDRGGTIRRVLFSDGGLSSNFPIHFFDALLPRRPTFGISLEPAGTLHTKPRVVLPTEPDPDPWRSYLEPEGPIAFLSVALDAMQEWQDRLQTALPGYRERVADVYLEENEGGFDVDMPQPVIDDLTKLGAQAGALLASGAFDFDDHRWRRFLVAYARLEETLATSAERWGAVAGPNGRTLAQELAAISKAPKSFGGTPAQTMTAMLARFDALMAHVSAWNGPLAPHADIPQPESALRITPRP